MNLSKYIMRCTNAITVNGFSIDFDLHVLTLNGKPVEHYELMCEAINSDARSLVGILCVMKWIEKVESEQMDLADIDGNGWVINITREKVWFEGLYSQGEGGEVSLPQFKLALETYRKFLNDPERKTVEVEFPEH